MRGHERVARGALLGAIARKINFADLVESDLISCLEAFPSHYTDGGPPWDLVGLPSQSDFPPYANRIALVDSDSATN